MDNTMKPTVYLAGPITGLTYKDAANWRVYAKDKLAEAGIVAYSPTRAKEYLEAVGVLKATDQYKGFNPLSDSPGIVARDRMDCQSRDLILANFLGAKMVSIGTCIEFGWADSARKPIVLAMEEGNPHEHGMIHQLTGFRVSDLDDAIELAKAILLP